MLKPHTQPHGACTCRADERSLRERAPLQAPGQLCWCLFATSARAGEAKGGRGRVCEVRVPSGWTRPTKSAWRCGCSLPLTVARNVDNPGVLDRCVGRLDFHKKVCGKFRGSSYIAFFELFVITCSLHGTRAVAGKILPALKLKHFEKGYIIGQASAGANHRGHLGGACTRAVRSPGISALRASPPAGPEAPRRATSGQTRAHEPKRVPTRSASTREQKTPLLPWPMQLISASPSARAERRHP